MEKNELYDKANKQLKESLEGVKGIIPRMATVAAVLKETFPYFLWCGFYFAEEGEMVIGPYQGNAACANINYDGVCGEGIKRKETVIVPDVHAFPGHIVCDERSNAEIVVPIFDPEQRLIGVLDVDSSEKGIFDETDKKHLEAMMPLLFDEE